ncbi:diiron oxygenase [Sorangium sp. So ce302]|uniref:diiron oxygenase n=1 Tax=unclassified Sorangium TaxID=2621164 RepID=UPI003F630436
MQHVEASAPEGDTVASWYEKATVRYTQRILIPERSSGELLYPTARSIVCDHPLVASRGSTVQSYILAQAAYQFLYGVGLLETKFVIDCSLNILHNHIKGAGDVDKLQALTVIIDEGYHAYVALDYIVQMKQKIDVEPLLVPESNWKLDAAARASASLPESMRMDFQLLAVTLAENVLTAEIASLGKEKEIARSFARVMGDHVLDEGRHSKYFAKLLKSSWARLPRETQETFRAMLPGYLDDFLGVDLNRAFERKVLAAQGFSAEEIDRIIDDTQERFVAEHQDAREKTKVRLVALLKQVGVFGLSDSIARQ